MRKRIVFFLVVGWCSLFSGQGWAMEAVAVSPALEGGEALVSACRPTFSWSQVEGAEAYEVMVFEAVNGEATAREDMAALYKPVISTNIPAPALSWTPSSESCLSQGGVYVWYVRGVDPDGSGVWSGGSRFTVDIGPSLSLMKKKVDEALTVYFSDEETVEQTFSGLETRIIESVTEKIQSGEIIAQGEEGDEQNNTYYGHGAGDSLDGTGKNNVFVGYNAGNATTSGSVNTFIGYYAGHKNTTPSNNTFVGGYAGQDNTTGFSNAFVGRQAGYFNTTGSQNTFVGMAAGTSNTTGKYNTFLGFAAGYSNTTSSYNTFVGRYAGYSNTTGKYNTFLGYGAGESNTTGDSNTFFGRDAGHNNETGTRNVFLGYAAGYDEIGSDRLYIDSSNTSSPLIYGEFDNDLLRVNGTLQFSSGYAVSDARYKTGVEPLKGALDAVLSLQGVSYAWNRTRYPDMGFEEGRRIGLIAQEAEKVLPEVVRTDRKGYKAVAYDQIVPVLIGAVKEQQAMLESQETMIKTQQAQIDELRAMVKALAQGRI